MCRVFFFTLLAFFSILLLNTIEYRKYWILNFQYYWIPKILNTEFSILLNIENVQYRIFNITEYRKKFQYRSSIIPKKKFNKNPRPTVNILVGHSVHHKVIKIKSELDKNIFWPFCGELVGMFSSACLAGNTTPSIFVLSFNYGSSGVF